MFVEIVRLFIVFLATAGGFALGKGTGASGDAVLVATSAVIDGRLLSLAKAGFLSKPLLVPPFVLDEIQGIADAQDPTRRRRGRRALEVLDALRQLPGQELHVLDDEVPEI